MSAPNWQEVKAVLDEGPSQKRRFAQRARMLEHRPGTRRRAPMLVAAAFVVALTVFVVARRPSPLAVNEAGVVLTSGTKASQPERWRFDEKSEVVIGEASSVELVALSSEAVELELSKGRVDVQVTHGTGRVWRVRAADFTIRVVGTRLHVSRRGQQVEVGVSEGVVEVLGPSALVRRVHAGEQWSNSEPKIELAVEQVRPVEAAVVAQHPKPKPLAVALTAPRAVDVVSWRTYFEQGDFERTVSAAQEQHALDDAPSLDANDVMALASAARLTGRSSDANRLLRIGLDKPGAHRAEAAFLLGRLELQQGRASEAADAFERSVNIAPTGELSEEAWARLFDTVSRLNDSLRLQRIAEAYLRVYPDGLSAQRANTVHRP